MSPKDLLALGISRWTGCHFLLGILDNTNIATNNNLYSSNRSLSSAVNPRHNRTWYHAQAMQIDTHKKLSSQWIIKTTLKCDIQYIAADKATLST